MPQVKNLRLYPYLFLKPWTASIGLMTLIWFFREYYRDQGTMSLLTVAVFISFGIFFWWRTIFKTQSAWAGMALGFLLIIVYLSEGVFFGIRVSFHMPILGGLAIALGLYELEPGKRSEWALGAFRLIVIQIYAFAAFAKIGSSFISGFTLEQIYISAVTGSFGAGLPSPEFFKILSYATFALELGLAIGLIFRRSRRLSIGTGIVFHIVSAFFMPVLLFSSTMVLCLLLFVNEEELG